ncbi:MAG: glutathione S-transferase [Alphaproteobacteria bacterium]
MKFYDCTTAPSPRRVRIFAAEKGIALDTVQVDLRNGEQFTAAFRAINPDCTVPALALDDGTVIADAVAICGYLEELHPEPVLIGSTAQERAVVTALNRGIERDGFFAAMDSLRNVAKGLKDRALPGPHNYAQIPELAERGRARLGHFFQAMDARLAEREFVAGSRYTIADISTMVLIDLAGWTKITVPDECANLRRWYAAVSARPSAKA